MSGTCFLQSNLLLHVAVVIKLRLLSNKQRSESCLQFVKYVTERTIETYTHTVKVFGTYHLEMIID